MTMRNNHFNSAFRGFGAMAVLATLMNLAFWLGLIYGGFKIAQHFGLHF